MLYTVSESVPKCIHHAAHTYYNRFWGLQPNKTDNKDKKLRVIFIIITLRAAKNV